MGSNVIGRCVSGLCLPMTETQPKGAMREAGAKP